MTTQLSGRAPIWEAGRVIVMRTVTGGRIRFAAPAFVIADGGSSLVCYRPPGTRNKVTKGTRVSSSRRDRELALRGELRDDRWELVDHVSDSGRGTLLFYRVGDWFSVWLQPAERDGDFVPVYINIETPFRRTPVGVDVDDLCLDVIVRPDLSWEFKDADDLRERAEEGIYSGEELEAIQGAAELSIQRIRDRSEPLDGSWASWRPDPTWPVPALRGDWDGFLA